MTLSFLIMKARSVSKPDLPEKPVTVLSEPQRKNGITLTSCVLASGWPPNKSFKWSDTKSLMDYGFLFSENTASGSKPCPCQNPGKGWQKKFVSLKPIILKETLTASFDSLKIVYRIPTHFVRQYEKNTPIGSIFSI